MNSNYDYTCLKCSHEFDFHEGLKLGGHEHEDWLECPMCKTLNIKSNEN